MSLATNVPHRPAHVPDRACGLRRLWVCVLLALGGLAACSTLNPVTLARMALLDPLTVPPGDVVVRLDLPEGLQVGPGDGVLEVSVARKSTGESIAERFELVQSETLWTLAPQDAVRLSALQDRARSWPEDDREGALSLSVTGCRVGAGPAPGVVINVDVSCDAGRSFAPLIRDLPASDVIGMAETGPDNRENASDARPGAGCLNP